MLGRVEDQELNGPSSLTELTSLALAGDQAAWRSLVRRLERVVWKTVNMCTSDGDIRSDAFAATWLRLAERLHSVREPEKLPGWLATTATNEVRALIRQRTRTEPNSEWDQIDDLFSRIVGAADQQLDELDRDLLRSEAASAVRIAFAQLDEECRMILTVLVIETDVSYRDASDRLQRPIGSLGPSRRRCLEKLRSHPSVRVLIEDVSND
jgi:RNA polymerase sigma factor (sigma-70 family)